MPNLNNPMEQFSAGVTGTLEDLIRRGSMLSTESKGVPYTASLKGVFREFVNDASAFLNGFKVGNFAKQKIETKELDEKIKLSEYSKVRQFTVKVPAGFNGRWIPFFEFLLKEIMPAVSTLEQTLSIANTKMAVVLNEPDRLKAQSGIRDLASKIALVEVTDFERMKAFFDAKGKTEALVSSVVDRNADIDTAFTLCNKLNAELSVVDFNAIQKLSDRLAQLTASLNETTDKEEFNEMSGLVTSQLSDLFYQMGVTLTAGAVLMDITKQMTDAMIISRDDLLQQLS